MASDFIFSLAAEGEFIIFNIKTGLIVKRKKIDGMEIMMHPNTYVNKLVFAGGNKM